MQEERITSVWKKLTGLSRVGKFSHSLHLLRQALRSFVISPLTAIISLTTVAAAMAVLNSFILIAINISEVVEDGELSCRIYFKDSTVRERLTQELKNYPGVEDVKYISATEAWLEFKENIGEELLLGIENENPLPESLLVTVSHDNQDLIPAIVQRYKNEPAVEYVQYDQQFVQNFTQAVLLFRRLIVISALALLIITAVIIASTVRLTLIKREDEIVIMRLVGAEKRDVILPCVIEGAIYGIVGASVGLLAAYLIWVLSGSLLSDLALINLLFPKSNFIPALGSCVLVLVGGLLGGLSSFAAVSKVSEK